VLMLWCVNDRPKRLAGVGRRTRDVTRETRNVMILLTTHHASSVIWD